MQDWIIDWREKISKIDEEIEIFLSSHENKREATALKISSDESKAIKKTEDTILKLRETYDREKITGEDFLLLIKEYRNTYQKNFRGNFRGRSYNRRGR